MTSIIEKAPPTPRSIKRMTILLLGLGVLAMCIAAAPAGAQGRGDHGRGHDKGNHGHHRGWNGGYYRAPPVVYGSPFGSSYYGMPRYQAPPLIYAPPGFSIQIR